MRLRPGSRHGFFARCAATLAVALLAPVEAVASAWNVPAGQGLVIVQGLYDTGSRAFDRKGRKVRTARYTKTEGWAYVEYGVTDWLQVIVQPDLVHVTVDGRPGGRYTGPGTSGAGAQVQLPGWGPFVFALQGTFRLPYSRAERNLALVGNTSRDTDARGLVGLPLQLGPWPGFLDAEAGFRYRGAPAPNEIHVDLTGGVRPRDHLLVLVQSFTTVPTESSARLFPRSTYSNLGCSLVYDIDTRWSVQVGAFGTVYGRDALRERGVQTGVWYRF